jgi:hypothetical protein
MGSRRGFCQIPAAAHLSELAGCSERTFFCRARVSGCSQFTLKGKREGRPSRPNLSEALSRRATGAAPKMRRIVLFLAILLLALATARSVVAGPQKKGTAMLTGVVLGPDDRPVPHAAITYQSSGGNAPHAVHADAHGHFTITKLRADNYDMRASGKGVFSEWQKNITVRSGQTKNVTLRLIYAKDVPTDYVKTKPNPQ